MTVPLIIDGDVEQLLIDYLTGQMPQFGYAGSVSDSVPELRPVESIICYRTGGPRRDLVTDRPQMTFECRAGLNSRAAQIALWVRALLNNLDGNGWVLGGHAIYSFEEMAGPYNDFDPVGNTPRYTQTGWVEVRAN